MTNLSPSTGDYLKSIYKLSMESTPVSTSDIAGVIGVSNASVTDMLKKLSRKSYLEHKPYYGVTLKPKGEKEALQLLRKHRLWELFLTEVLKISWDQVHEKAELLEHATDDVLEAKIAEFLGDPKFDPHGHPIPTKDGKIHRGKYINLTTLKPGDQAEIFSCTNEDPEILKYLESAGLMPGAVFEVVEIAPYDGPYVLKTGSKTVYISPKIAEFLNVIPG